MATRTAASVARMLHTRQPSSSRLPLLSQLLRQTLEAETLIGYPPGGRRWKNTRRGAWCCSDVLNCNCNCSTNTGCRVLGLGRCYSGQQRKRKHRLLTKPMRAASVKSAPIFSAAGTTAAAAAATPLTPIVSVFILPPQGLVAQTFPPTSSSPLHHHHHRHPLLFAIHSRLPPRTRSPARFFSHTPTMADEITHPTIKGPLSLSTSLYCASCIFSSFRAPRCACARCLYFILHSLLPLHTGILLMEG